MRALLALALLAPPLAHAGESLRCDFARGSVRDSVAAEFSGPLASAKVEQPNAAQLALEASIDASSSFWTLDDVAATHRVAFSGTPEAMGLDGATLSLGATSVACRRQSSAAPSFALAPATPKPNYFVCMVDEARFQAGKLAETKRHFFQVLSSFGRNLPLVASGSDAQVSFRVDYAALDPFHGLEVALHDKASGETARFSGPARSMASSLLFGLTVGDRAKDARFLRLGCVWTNEPATFKPAP